MVMISRIIKLPHRFLYSRLSVYFREKESFHKFEQEMWLEFVKISTRYEWTSARFHENHRQHVS